ERVQFRGAFLDASRQGEAARLGGAVLGDGGESRGGVVLAQQQRFVEQPQRRFGDGQVRLGRRRFLTGPCQCLGLEGKEVHREIFRQFADGLERERRIPSEGRQDARLAQGDETQRRAVGGRRGLLD